MQGEKAVLVSPTALHSFCQACFQKLGLPASDAALTADNLLFANLRGLDSHGVLRLKIYADRLRCGGVRPDAVPRLVAETESTALLDAQDGVGQVAATQAMRLAMAKAEKTGAGAVGVRNSNHFGAAAFYAMMALERNLVGLAASNASPSMAPTGGREARLGNNPFALAVPTRERPPLVLDMATGAVAWGKIFVARQEGKPIPSSWALDASGLPTEDPEKAMQGGLIQPLGGYKGYGLSLLVDVLTGILTGSAFSIHVRSMYREPDRPTRCGHFLAALRIDAFAPSQEFGRQVDEILELMHSCPPAPGVDRIYVPGQIEEETQRQRRQQGIPISPALREELEELARELEIPPPF